MGTKSQPKRSTYRGMKGVTYFEHVNNIWFVKETCDIIPSNVYVLMVKQGLYWFFKLEVALRKPNWWNNTFIFKLIWTACAFPIGALSRGSSIINEVGDTVSFRNVDHRLTWSQQPGLKVIWADKWVRSMDFVSSYYIESANPVTSRILRGHIRKNVNAERILHVIISLGWNLSNVWRN